MEKHVAPKKKHSRKTAPRKSATSARRSKAPGRVAAKKTTKPKAAAPRKRNALGQFTSRKKSETHDITNRVREVAAPELLTREYADEVQKQAANGFVESRHFNTSAAFLGYLEGRPGVKGLVTVWQQLSEGAPSSKWTPTRRREVLERLEATPPALEKKAEGSSDGGPSYEEWRDRMMEALEWADDGGILTEVEVENDSGVET